MWLILFLIMTIKTLWHCYDLHVQYTATIMWKFTEAFVFSGLKKTPFMKKGAISFLVIKVFAVILYSCFIQHHFHAFRGFGASWKLMTVSFTDIILSFICNTILCFSTLVQVHFNVCDPFSPCTLICTHHCFLSWQQSPTQQLQLFISVTTSGFCYFYFLPPWQLLKHLDVINIWQKHISSSLPWQIYY